jgi:DNA-binding transcriptional regulator WhiA
VDALGARVGKSGMNHRLRKLEQIADELQDGGNHEPVS